MWHTNCGDRTLEGAEARLFAEALWDFVSELVRRPDRGARIDFLILHYGFDFLALNFSLHEIRFTLHELQDKSAKLVP